MFDFDDIEENDKINEENDSGHDWFPHHTPRGSAAGAVVCIGPPSLSHDCWIASGPTEAGRVLLAACEKQNLNLFTAQWPADGLSLCAAAKSLSRCLQTKGPKHGELWVLVGASLGVWVAEVLVEELRKSAPSMVGSLKSFVAAALPPCSQQIEGKIESLSGNDGMLLEGKEEASNAVSRSLRMPVVAFWTTADKSITKKDMEAWRMKSDGTFHLHALHGNQYFLQNHEARTEFFWVLASRALRIGGFRVQKVSDVADYQQAALEHGHLPRPRHGLFAENDRFLKSFFDNKDLKPIQPHTNGGIIIGNGFAAGDAHTEVDVRLFVDVSANRADEDDPTGCKMVAAVMVGWMGCVGAHPGSGTGIHGGCIQTIMSEVMQECFRFHVFPSCNMDSSTHEITKGCSPYTPYHVECVFTSSETLAATMKDWNSEAIYATSTGEMSESF